MSTRLLSGPYIEPAGILKIWPTNTPPIGWLLCYGQAISRALYAKLFGVIDTTFGIGDGSTTFNVPDFRGRIPLGKDNMGGASANRVTSAQADAIGGAAGDETLAAHVHTGPSHVHTGPAHVHTTPVETNGGSIGHTGDIGDGNSVPINTGSSGTGNTGAGGTGNTGSTGAGSNNMTPYLTMNYIIKT